MFTGIVKAVGTVADIESTRGDARLRIESGALPWTEYADGDSILVNGVCLTAGALDGRGFSCDVSRETLGVTTLGSLRPGSRVNLEPALRAGEPLGGHIVQGHVDGTATVRTISDEGDSIRIGFEAGRVNTLTHAAALGTDADELAASVQYTCARRDTTLRCVGEVPSRAPALAASFVQPSTEEPTPATVSLGPDGRYWNQTLAPNTSLFSRKAKV